MNRQPLTVIHRTAGVVAFLTIAAFFSSTVYSEFFGDQALVVQVKHAILWCLPLLIGSMMLTGLSGNKLYPAKGKGVMGRKQMRMKLAAMNGTLVMLPAAVFLFFKASAGEFDAYFWTVQGIELVGGALNLSLIGLNIRDGLSLKKAKQPRQQAA
ncbi:hypothetical protein [Enterovibrio baiacu]|uniref:hypothetical protein n=1 Tax=Enterovibrio baiacu TaxID=2491023 RepID=UPI003D13D90C